MVGAGAAGIMAALTAAELLSPQQGPRVLLLEKNKQPGLKVLISGGGRCNLTTAKSGADLEREYGQRRGRWLRHALRSFQPQALRAFIEAAGVPLQEEDLEKIFPVSGRAQDIMAALLRLLQDSGAELRTQAPLQSLDILPTGGFRLQLPDSSVSCSKLILATGGLSYPRTGATGDGYAWCRQLGHGLQTTMPALAPLLVEAEWVRALSGITMPDMSLTLLDAKGKRLAQRRRPVLFTHKGLSGPGPMDLSGAVEEHSVQHGQDCRLQMNFLPHLNREALQEEMLQAAQLQGRRLVLNCLPGRLPERLRLALLGLAGIPATGVAGCMAELRREQRIKLLDLLQSAEVKVRHSLGFKHAEVTRGGVPLPEVDPRSMQSKLCPDLFLCGEILDIDGPIGGFNFQAAFATGRLAGLHAAKALDA